MLSIGHFLSTEHLMAVCEGCTLPTSWNLLLCQVQPLLLFLLHLQTEKTNNQREIKQPATTET